MHMAENIAMQRQTHIPSQIEDLLNAIASETISECTNQSALGWYENVIYTIIYCGRDSKNLKCSAVFSDLYFHPHEAGLRKLSPKILIIDKKNCKRVRFIAKVTASTKIVCYKPKKHIAKLCFANAGSQQAMNLILCNYF